MLRYHESLLENEETLSYLDARLLDLDIVRGSRLGLVTEADPLHERYRGWLSIPFLTPTGPVGMKFRCLEPDCPHEGHGKYEYVTGQEANLYNVLALHQATNEVAVCEGELDGLVSTSVGLPAVGVPAKVWKKFWYRLFEDFDRVLFLGDGDPAGRDFAQRHANYLPNGVARPMPEGQDVTSFVLTEGAEEFLRYISV